MAWWVADGVNPRRNSIQAGCSCFTPWGQLDPEGASFSWLGIEADPTAHALGGAPHDRQADTSSLVFAGGMNPLEHPEDPLALVTVNAYAVILDIDSHQGVMFFCPNADVRLHSGGDELHGIAHQIGKALRQ